MGRRFVATPAPFVGIKAAPILCRHANALLDDSDHNLGRGRRRGL
jgi:hypothetical protein